MCDIWENIQEDEKYRQRKGECEGGEESVKVINNAEFDIAGDHGEHRVSKQFFFQVVTTGGRCGQ